MKAFLDLETGGFSITKNGVCEIALIAVDEQLKPVDTFHALIKPYTRADDTNELVSYKEDAITINGLTEKELIEKGLDISIVTSKICEFLIMNKISVIIGHNSKAFDFPRLKYLLERFSGAIIDDLLQEDTMIIAKEKLSLPSYSLENLCKHFGISNTKAHSSEGDTLATIELYKILKQ